MNYNIANTDNTNTSLLVDSHHSQLALYCTNPRSYKCPADPTLSGGTKGAPRVRSYSMSQAVGPNTNGTVYGTGGAVVQGKWLGSTSDSGSVNAPNLYSAFAGEHDAWRAWSCGYLAASG
jgi:hypothetical protein